jgi:hypothetical protein
MISASSQSARRILVASLGSFVLDASFARFFAALFASYGSRSPHEGRSHPRSFPSLG